MQILNRYTKKIIFEYKTNNIKIVIEKAIKNKINLSEADFSRADLSWADFSRADLFGADFSRADLSWADFSRTDLSWADFSRADLSWADLDFSSGFTFACKTFNIKADIRLATQLAYHFCKFNFEDCPDAKEAQVTLKKLANQFHRVNECGKIE